MTKKENGVTSFPLGEGSILTMGILGLGEGRSTMSAALQSTKLNLKTICDRNEELCKQRCKEFDFTNYTTSYEEMLNDEAIDIIAIYTPDHLHAAHIKQALLHNKHVVCLFVNFYSLPVIKRWLRCLLSYLDMQ